MNSAALWRIRWAWKLAPQNVLLKGTPFQLSIWKALIDSPSLTHYSSLAEQAGCPKSYRAAANALGENPESLNLLKQDLHACSAAALVAARLTALRGRG